MLDKIFTINELDNVIIRTLTELKIGNRIISKNEPVLILNNLQIFDVKIDYNRIGAEGNNYNDEHVFWSDANTLQIKTTKGYASITDLSIFTDSNSFEEQESLLSVIENHESNEDGIIKLKHELANENFFLYAYIDNKKERIYTYEIIDNKTIKINAPYINIQIIYYYKNGSKNAVINLGESLQSFYFELEGTFKIKEEHTKIIRTGILKIPKISLLNNITVSFNNKVPEVYGLNIKGFPVGKKGNRTIATINYLNEDISSDL